MEERLVEPDSKAVDEDLGVTPERFSRSCPVCEGDIFFDGFWDAVGWGGDCLACGAALEGDFEESDDSCYVWLIPAERRKT